MQRCSGEASLGEQVGAARLARQRSLNARRVPVMKTPQLHFAADTRQPAKPEASPRRAAALKSGNAVDASAPRSRRVLPYRKARPSVPAPAACSGRSRCGSGRLRFGHASHGQPPSAQVEE
jgi:hypothetical protein